MTLVNMTGGLVCATFPHHFVICKQFINFERERGQRALAVLFVFFFSFLSVVDLVNWSEIFPILKRNFLAQDLRQICIIHKTRRCHVYTNLFMAKLGLSPRHPISFAFFFILPFVSFILSYLNSLMDRHQHKCLFIFLIKV